MNEKDDFFKRYKLIASTSGGVKIIPHKKACRFCELGEEQVTFKKKAHLISELLGRNNSHSYDECDKCNELFSKYESHLSKFFLPNLTMIGVQGKKRIPSFHSRTNLNDQETRTTITYNSETHEREISLKKEIDLEINHENNTAVLRFRQPK